MLRNIVLAFLTLNFQGALAGPFQSKPLPTDHKPMKRLPHELSRLLLEEFLPAHHYQKVLVVGRFINPFISLTANPDFRGRFTLKSGVWVNRPQVFRGQVIHGSWSYDSYPMIAMVFGEILANGQSPEQQITEMNNLYRNFMVQSGYLDRRTNNQVNPVLMTIADLIVWNQVKAQVWAQVWAQVGDRIRAQAGNQVRDQVWHQFWDQVWHQFWDQVWHQFWHQVTARVRDQVWDQVWDQVRTQIGDQVNATFPRTNLLSALRPIIHYVFLVYQLTAHFRMDHSFLNEVAKDNNITNQTFINTIPALTRFIQGQLGQLPDDDAHFLIRLELERMLSHFPIR